MSGLTSGTRAWARPRQWTCMHESSKSRIADCGLRIADFPPPRSPRLGGEISESFFTPTGPEDFLCLGWSNIDLVIDNARAGAGAPGTGQAYQCRGPGGGAKKRHNGLAAGKGWAGFIGGR